MSTLTKCRDCGGTVSTKADQCPHCGSKTFSSAKESEQHIDTIMSILGGIFVLFILYKSGWWEWFKGLF